MSMNSFLTEYSFRLFRTPASQKGGTSVVLQNVQAHKMACFYFNLAKQVIRNH